MQRRFTSGQRVRKLPTYELNEAINAARDREVFGSRRGGLSVSGQFEVSIENDTGSDLEQWQVVGLDGAAIDPADNEQGFRDWPVFSGIQPLHADHLEQFALLTGPVADGQVGRALLSGLINCKVNVNNVEHRYVRPQDNTLDLLETCGAGGGRIRWPFPFTATGEQWATVELTPFTGEAYGYLTADLQPATTAGSPLVLTASTTTMKIFDFDSSAAWYNTDDEITLTNVWEGVSATEATMVAVAMRGGKWMLSSLGCQLTDLDLS